MKSVKKALIWSYILLAARCLLAYTLVSYGWAKLTGHQFGVDTKTMNMRLKDIDLLRLSWYMADHEPFKSFIGLSQLVAAVLLLLNRTVLIGAFVSIPIWLNILIWDLTFMDGFTSAFTFRLMFYLLLTGLIVWQHRLTVLPALMQLTQPQQPYRYPSWVYLTLPVAMAGLELIGAIPSAIAYGIRLAGHRLW